MVAIRKLDARNPQDVLDWIALPYRIYQDEPIEGTDLGASFGFGTEYRLGRKMNLDMQVLWGFVKTGDEIKFEGLQAPENGSFYWTNTHFWNVSLGVVIGL